MSKKRAALWKKAGQKWLHTALHGSHSYTLTIPDAGAEINMK
jgi:hypothetical protein